MTTISNCWWSVGELRDGAIQTQPPQVQGLVPVTTSPANPIASVSIPNLCRYYFAVSSYGRSYLGALVQKADPGLKLRDSIEQTFAELLIDQRKPDSKHSSSLPNDGLSSCCTIGDSSPCTGHQPIHTHPPLLGYLTDFHAKYTAAAIIRNWKEVHRRSIQEVARFPTPTGEGRLYISGEQAAGQPLLLRLLGITHVVCCFKAEKLIRNFPDQQQVLLNHLQINGTKPASEVEDTDNIHSAYLKALIALGIERLSVPMEDKENYDLLQHFEPCTEWIYAALTGKATCQEQPTQIERKESSQDRARPPTPRSTRVLVHCMSGFHRSSATVAAFLLSKRCRQLQNYGRSDQGSTRLSVAECLQLLKSRREGAEPIPAAVIQLERWYDMQS
jgi:hypothetical protein